MKRTYLFILALILLLASVVSACSKTEENGATEGVSTNTPAPSTKDYTLPIVAAGSVTLSYAAQDNIFTSKSYTQGLPVWNEVEKRTGVKIKWDVSPAGQYNDTMKVRLSAGKNLPDIITIPEADPVRLSTTGLIIPLDDLIAQHAPNIRKYFKDFPDREAGMRAPDGKIYALTSDVSGTAYTEPVGLFVRKDWLDKLNLQNPKTLDEWYTVLKAFKEKDPNGNKKDDEIPFSPRFGLEGLTGMFGGAVGLHLFYSGGWYPDNNGKVQYQWMDDRAKQLITWLNKLYTAGLIDPEFMKATKDSLASKVTRNLVGASQGYDQSLITFNDAQKKAGTEANWVLALPPSTEGYKGFYEKYGPSSGWAAISKDCKDPVTAIKWLDYIYASEEGSRLLAFGIEGQSYTMVNGEAVFTDWTMRNPDGLSYAEALRSIGAMPVTVWNRTESGPLSKQPYAFLKQIPELLTAAELVKSYMVDSFQYMSALPTSEEAQESAKLLADIHTYRDETLTKFIMGQSPIDWDKFVSTLKSLGIEKVMKIKQAQYDRFKKNK